jgi:hypothetical protein
MLGVIILDRVDSITDLGVVINSRMSFAKFVKYALRGLERTDMYDVPPYISVLDVISGRVGSPNLLSLVNVIVSRYCTQGGDFLRIDFYTTVWHFHYLLN